MLAFRIFQDSALKLRAVPEDEQGIDIEYLRTQIQESEAKARAASSRSQVSITCLRAL
jgi:DNA-binding transcriptional MocR family regulator